MEGLVLFTMALAGAAWVAVRPEWGAPYFAALIYLRLSDSLRGEFGLPSLFMIVAPGLLLLAAGRWLFAGTPVGRGWRVAIWLLAAYGAVCAGSLLYAMDPQRTLDGLANYLDGVVIVLVMAIYLRTPLDLDRTLWALLIGGAVLGSLTVYQQLTGSYDQVFAGLARAGLRNIHDAASGYRSEGPVSANYFALILVVVVPLAVDRLVHERRLLVRAVSAWALAGVVASVAFTYSRGGVVALAATALPLLAYVPRRHAKRWILVGAVAAVGLTAVLIPTRYGQRLAALVQLAGAVQGEAPRDSALRGRVSEVTSAAMMFADHPVIGVGYGNFEEHYHRYARNLGLDGRSEERQAHSLYLEVAAETGLVGVAAFAGVLAYPIVGMRRTHSALRRGGRARDAQRVAAFGFALFAYLVGSLFLHLSYPRYLWLLLGIAIAVGAFSDGDRSVAPDRPGAGEPAR
jgi:O-antigen ligase